MTTIPRRLTLIATAPWVTMTLTCASALAAKPVTYTYTTFSVPNAISMSAVALNASGTMVGNWADQNDVVHGYIFQNGAVALVDDPKQVYGTQINGINKNGKIVGHYLDGSLTEHGFVYDIATKTFTDVEYPGATNGTNLNAIDTKGEIFGIAVTAGNVHTAFKLKGKTFTTLPIGNTPLILGASHNGNLAGTDYLPPPAPYTGFIYSGGVATTIPTPAGTGNTEVYSINSSGTAVGTAYGLTTANQPSGFIFSGGTLTAVNVPGTDGANGTALFGINDAGTCIVLSTDASHLNHNFLYVPSTGTYTALAGPKGSSYVGVSAINNAAQVIGTYFDAKGKEHGFIATPK